MALETPMKHVKENLLFTKSGQCWAYYVVTPNYLHEGNHIQSEEHKKNMQLLFFKLSKFTDIHLQMFPSEMRIEERFADLEKDYDPNMLDVGRYYNQRALNVLRDELINISEYTFIIGVRITNTTLTSETTVKELVGNSAFNVNNKLVNWFGFEKEIDQKEYDSYKESEREARLYVSSGGGSPISEDMLYYIVRHNFIRGLPHTYATEVEERGKNISDSVLDTATYVGYTKIMHDYGESFVAFLPLSKTPDNLQNIELFWLAQTFSFPVEVQMKLKKRGKTMLQNKIGSTAKLFKETDKDMYNNDDSDDEILGGLGKLNYLRNKVNNNNFPLFDWLACFVVTGRTKEECLTRAQEVKETLKDNECRAVQPQADQLNLFYKFLHGRALNPIEPNWLQSTTHEGLSELQFGMSQKLGSNIGQYVGRITWGVHQTTMNAIQSSRFLVLAHFFLADEGVEGSGVESPHIAITGSTGKGKSYLAKLIAFYLAFLRGQVLMTDPKNEVKEWFDLAKNDPYVQENFPQFIKLIEQLIYVTLDPDDPQNYGVLDPLTFLHGSKARDSVLTMFEELFPNQPLKVENFIRRELDKLILQRAEGAKVGLMNLIHTVRAQDEEDISEVGENMYLKIKDSILQLAFSDGTTEPLNVENKFTILQIKGLELPEPDVSVDEFTEQDRKNLALMNPLANFCQYFGMRDKLKKTTVIFDEAWTLTKARGGKKLIKGLRRIGRSYSNQLILVTQSVDDIQNDDDSGNFGLCFAFDEPAEREKILAHMGLENNAYNREMLSTLKKGQCLFKDMYNRVGQLSVDCPFSEWTLAFKTKEKSHSAQSERKYDQ